MDVNGGVREGGDVAEVTGLIATDVLIVEDGIGHAKDADLGRFPSGRFNINEVWLILVQIAADLTA